MAWACFDDILELPLVEKGVVPHLGWKIRREIIRNKQTLSYFNSI